MLRWVCRLLYRTFGSCASFKFSCYGGLDTQSRSKTRVEVAIKVHFLNIPAIQRRKEIMYRNPS